jgi:hypothetical protein
MLNISNNYIITIQLMEKAIIDSYRTGNENHYFSFTDLFNGHLLIL